MKRLLSISLIVTSIICLFSAVYGQVIQSDYSDEIVEVKLIPLSSNIEEGIVKMAAELKVVNTSIFSLKDVSVNVSEFYGLSISPTTIYVGDISGNDSVISKEEIFVQYPVPSQDDTNVEQYIKWTVNYVLSSEDTDVSFTNKSSIRGQQQSKRQSDFSGMRISEIMFLPKYPDTESQWVELFNDSDNEVDIVGYQICNSSGVVYSFPETVPLVPPGGYLLVVFDGQGPNSDDLSFEANNIVTLHSDMREVFAVEGDVCALFAGKPHSRETIRGFVSWGDIQKGAERFLRKAQSRKLWGKDKTKFSISSSKIEKRKGPGPALREGGTLGIIGTPKKFDPGEWSVFTASEVSPGAKNPLPAPLLFLPEDETQTSEGLFAFSWFPFQWAHHYHLQICRDKECAIILIEETNLIGHHFQPQESFGRAGKYYWRVRSVNAQGRAGSWSEIRMLQITGSPGPTSGSLESEIYEQSKGQSNPLGVPALAARKDTNLLCLDGCERSSVNNHQWDGPHTALAHWWDHESGYCWATAIAMMNRYFGGNITRDEVAWRVKGQDADPEGGLAHGQWCVDSETTGGLAWALNTAESDLNYSRARPTNDQLISWIDAGRPIMYSTPIHWMVVDGYRSVGGTVEGRFINVDNDGGIDWRPFSTHNFDSYFVPNSGLTPRNTDPRISSDSDGDGIMDFDEDERFPTDKSYPDTEWDGVPDKPDVASYTFRGINSDVDGDGIRGEADEDSDDDGLQDGLEDLDHDGNYEPEDGETDPHDARDDTAAEIIGTWSNGIWYWDVTASQRTQMYPSTPTGDIAAGDFTGDGKADVASCWGSSLWYQDGITLGWTKVSGSAPDSVTAGDVTGDSQAEIIGTWSNGIWYYDAAKSKWTKMAASTPTGDIAAGDFTGDGKADVASIWSSGLWYQDGATLNWTKVGSAPNSLTAGDVTGDGRFEIIGTWSNGIWYYDAAKSKWTKMAASTPTGDIAAGDFTGDGKADVASCWSNGLWYQDGATLGWTKVSNTAPTQVTAGDITGG